MSVSSIGSSSSNPYLQRLLQPDDSDPSAATAPSDPLQALFRAISGGQSNNPDPLVAAATSDNGSATSSGAPQFSPDVMQALMSVQGNQAGAGGSKLEQLLGKFDTNGDGQISQSEFETAIGPGADKAKVDELFKKLDANGDGAVSQDELKAAVQKVHGGHHHHHAEGAGEQGGAGGSGGSDPLQALLSSAGADGATSQSATNADGSSTTTITYADGTKVAMTTPAAASAAGTATADPEAPNFANLLKQLISLQAQLAAPTTSMSV
jgi:hypothetical protein